MGETSYHKEKIYLPRDVREKLGLVEGDRLYVEATDSGEARLIVIRASKAGKRILERLDNPPNLGELKGKIRREEIYEDIT